MSPFDIAILALPISFIIAVLPGPSAMLPPAATDFAMLSLVHFIIAAEAGATITAETRAAASRIFIGVSPIKTWQRTGCTVQREPLRSKMKDVSRQGTKSWSRKLHRHPRVTAPPLP